MAGSNHQPSSLGLQLVLAAALGASVSALYHRWLLNSGHGAEASGGGGDPTAVNKSSKPRALSSGRGSVQVEKPGTWSTVEPLNRRETMTAFPEYIADDGSVNPTAKVAKHDQPSVSSSLVSLVVNVQENMRKDKDKVICVGIAGGTGSGKTTLVHALEASLGDKVVTLSHDSYYKDLSHLNIEERSKQNFDHPEALDSALMLEHVIKLRRGDPVDVPVYDFSTHSRLAAVERKEPAKVVIVEGILIFAYAPLIDQLDMKVFVETDSDIRLMRRLKRDIVERGRSVESVMHQYITTVRPMHMEFVEPSKHKADIIVPVGVNPVALDLLTTRLKEALR